MAGEMPFWGYLMVVMRGLPFCVSPLSSLASPSQGPTSPHQSQDS